MLLAGSGRSARAIEHCGQRFITVDIVVVIESPLSLSAILAVVYTVRLEGAAVHA